MAKTIFEQMSGTYTIQGGYRLHDLALPPEERLSACRRIAADST